MFGGGRSRHVDAHVAVGVVFQPLLRPAFDLVAVAQPFEVAIEQSVQPPVGGLLAHKPLHFPGKTPALGLRQRLEAGPYGVDEVLLAHRKTHGQGTEEGRPKRIAAIPPPGERRIQVDQQAAHDKVGHFKLPGHKRGPRHTPTPPELQTPGSTAGPLQYSSVLIRSCQRDHPAPARHPCTVSGIRIARRTQPPLV